MMNLQIIYQFLIVFSDLLFSTFITFIVVYFIFWVIEQNKLAKFIKNINLLIFIVLVFTIASIYILKTVL